MAAMSTAIPLGEQATKRGAASSTEASTVTSPLDSPRHSASSTSLSSLDENMSIKQEKPLSSAEPLRDGYGNVFETPDYTIKQIYDAIPKHCFERSAVRSLGYLLRDFVCLGVTFTLFYNFNTPEYVANKPIRAVLWALYTVLQGMFGTGVWVLAHECGHQAFSPSKVLNDTVGWICHSALLVPYFSWKISHGKHHKATGNLARDMVFVPRTREQQASRVGKLVHELGELMEETPIVTALDMIVQQLFGWPMYLLTNVTGHNCHEAQVEGKGKGKQNGHFGGVNHFLPSSPLYERKDEKLILLSDLGLALVGTGLYYLGNTFGWSNMLVWYFIPYLWVNHWLVAITFLQHTDPSLPHYHPDAWDFTKGAAATIDRELGFIGRHLLHGIAETHVLHHYVSTIPFYNADEASEAIKKVMGKHYRSDTKGGPFGFFAALWRSSRHCQWVEPCEHAQGKDRSILFFRNSNGLGVPPAKN